jgi:tubulin monoglycylase TTLL3/8
MYQYANFEDANVHAYCADDITANGNMWDVPQFKSWLAATYGDPGLWESVIQPAMKHIVVCTTKCAQDMVKARKNSCQIYG